MSALTWEVQNSVNQTQF